MMKMPTLLISTTTLEVFEDAGNFAVEFELTGATENDVSFKYALGGGSATKVTDYTEAMEAERTLTISGGDTTKSISIPIIDDTLAEDDETFILTLSNLTGAVFASGGILTETITILDDEAITLTLSTTDFSVAENIGGDGFEVEVELSKASGLDVTFDYDLTDATATENEDYVETSDSTVTISAGDTTATFTIPILDDLDLEGTQTFTLGLFNLIGAKFANNVATITKTISIVDNETPIISITPANLSVSEGVGSSGLELRLELQEANHIDVRINHTTTDITAEKGLDYTDTSGTVTIEAGETTGTITVPITDDTDVERSQTFRINLTAQGIAEFESSLSNTLELTITILDNDAPTISIADAPMVTESDVSGSPAYAKFTVSTPVDPVTNNFTIQYTPTSADFAVNSGTERTSPTLDFSDADGDGIYTAELRVEIASDSDPELNSELEVTLNADTVGSEKYFVGSTATASVFVIDDDAAIPELSLGSIADPIAENTGEVQFTIFASESPGREITVYYTPAEVGQGDFLTDRVATLTSSDVNFQLISGREQATITVDLDNDTNAELTGMIQVTLNTDSAPEQTYTVVNGDARSSIATILDNDAPILSIAGGEMVTESDVSGSPAYAIYTISSPVEPATNNFTVQYTPTSTDFAINSGTERTSHTLEFTDPDGDGNYSAELRVEIASDDIAELNSDLEVMLNPDTIGSEKYFVGSTATATTFVVDDDATIPELSFENNTNPVAESTGPVNFTVIASADPERDLTIYYTPAEVGQGDFLTDSVATKTSSKVTFQNISGREQATITVNLDNDTTAEPTGMIEVTLNTDSAPAQTYTVVAGDTSQTTATILDNDAPALSITGGSFVTESDVSGSPAHAIFTISSSVEPTTNNFTIQYTPTSSAFAINSGTPIRSHTLDFSDLDGNGIYTAELRVEIDSDDVAEVNEDLQVTLNPDTVGSEKYFVSSPASASVFVVDDDAGIPLLSIEDVSSPVFENNAVEFTITTTTDPKRPVIIQYSPTDVDGDYILTQNEQTTPSPALQFVPDGNGNFTTTLTVNPHNDNVTEGRASIRVTLVAESEQAFASTYQIDTSSPSNSATAIIWDNDAPELSIVGWR